MRKIHLLTSAAAILACLMLAGCGSSTKFIELSSGIFDSRAESIEAVLNDDELPLLDGFTALKELDLTGSTCYDAIADWADAHPEVAVIYAVIMPDGRSLAPEAESIDLSSVPAELAAQSLSALSYFPQLRSVELGTVSGRFTPDDIKSFSAERRDIELTGQTEILGEKYDMHTESLDLSLLSHENAAEVLSTVEYLIDIKSLNLGGDETNDLTFDDVAAFEEAFPDAEFSYDFTLFGKPYSVNTKKVNLSQVKMDDNGEAVRAALRCMKKCDYLDMDSCGVDSEHMAAIRDEFPQIEVVWRVFFGDNYTARTNTDRILASAWNGGGELGCGNVGWRVNEDEYGNKSWNPRYYELRELFGYKNSPYCYNYTFNDPYCYSPYPTPPED